MLTLNFDKPLEFYNEETGTFVEIKPQKINLEHSLISISKWEAIHHKPFLTKEEKTPEEVISYVKCMTLTSNVPDELYLGLTQDMVDQIMKYINDPMSATEIGERTINGKSKDKGKKPDEVLTSELLYYSMISYNIPTEFQKWHLNRLITLIKVCHIKNQDPEDSKMSKQDILEYQRMLNAQRRKAKANMKGK